MQTESPRFIERDHEAHAWTDMISAMARLSECLSGSNKEIAKIEFGDFMRKLDKRLLDSKKEKSCQ